MTNEDRLFKLFLTSQEKIQNACSSFEEHFAWLAEAVVAARKSLASEYPALLPKTPRKGRRTKRALPPVVTEDEVPPVKRSSTDSQNEIENDEANTSAQPPPRRGRAASRLAQQKMKKDLELKVNMKMRRPSSPEQITTTIKKRGTRQATQNNTNRSEPEGDISKETKTRSPRTRNNQEKESVSDLKLKLVLSPLNITPKKSISNSTKHLSVNLNRVRLSSEKISRVDSGSNVNKDPEADKENISYPQQIIIAQKEKENIASTTQEVISDLKEMSHNTTKVTHSETENSCNTTQINVADVREEQDGKGSHKEETPYLVLRFEDSNSDGEEHQEPQASTESDEEVISASPVHGSSKRKSMTKRLLCKASENSESEDDVILCSPSKSVPRGRVTRTKQRALQSNVTDSDTVEPEKKEESVAVPVAKPRSVHTKQKKADMEGVGDKEMLPPTSFPKPRATRTKVKAKEVAASNDTELSNRSTEEKVDAKESHSESREELPKIRSTRTKRKVEVEVVEDSGVNMIEGVESMPQKCRSTRTKKRQVEAEDQAHTINTKRRKTGEHEESEKGIIVNSQSSESNCGEKSKSPSSQSRTRCSTSQDSVSSSGVSSAKSVASVVSAVTVQPTQTAEPVRRITRSKMRQAQSIKSSPVKALPKTQSPSSPGNATQAGYHRDCLTPKGADSARIPIMRPGKSPARYSPRPNGKFRSANKEVAGQQHRAAEMLNDVEEVTEIIEVGHSLAHIKRHSIGKGNWGEKKLDPGLTAKTRSPMTSEKGMKGRPPLLHLSGASVGSGFGSSSRFSPKTLSRIQLSYTSSSSSAEYNKTQTKLMTHSGGRRPLNIITGVNSLTSIIKVQPPKLTREELEEQKQQELLKKREKAEETRRKKEEMLKAKAEERKRANEERMRRVQEAREKRERKAMEAKEQQERERRQREERQREEQQRRKQQLLAKKKAEEEIRALKIKEQEEEERRRKEEERRKQIEEERRLEEIKRQEEEKRAQLAEQRRLQEEERRRRVAEAERIAREKREMERLKQQEAQRKVAAASPKVGLNDTYTASSGSGENKTGHNTTYTAHNSTYTADKPTVERSDSYEMTPARKSKKDKTTANNYGIDNLKSDDSTDDDSKPKKKIPAWAMKSQLNIALIQQEYYPPNVDQIFTPEDLLMPPNLSSMFATQRRRFFKRTSSAIWNTPPITSFQTS